MSLTHHIGYGRFQLQDLLPGEEFARFDGSRAKLCDKQPYREWQPICNHPYLPDHFEVWIDYGTSNATKVFLHRTALVHALTAEQAQQIDRRLKQRKEMIHAARETPLVREPSGESRAVGTGPQ